MSFYSSYSYVFPVLLLLYLYKITGTTQIYAELLQSVEVEYQRLAEIQLFICFRMAEFQQLDRKSRVCWKGSQKCKQQQISVLGLLLFIIKYVFPHISIYSMHVFSFIHTIFTTLKFSNIYLASKKLYVTPTHQIYQVFGRSYPDFQVRRNMSLRPSILQHEVQILIIFW